MEILEESRRKYRRIPRIISLETFVVVLAALSAIVMIWTILTASMLMPVIIISGIIFTVCICAIIFLLMSPDTVRARQTDSMLKLSSRMVDLMSNGMTFEAAQCICELLLPSTTAIAVAITDRTTILGYAGYLEAENPKGSKIRTQVTHQTMQDGKARVLFSAEEIGLPKNPRYIKAAIIVPLRVGRDDKDIRGTLKFYFRSADKITETQKSIAQGFGELLSTQMTSLELEEQREVATAMELKMLQNQINPHFLFNTINTIASLIRTDPMKARELLREFAVFYRSMLENAQDQIPLMREIEQTCRYFTFEVARFGEDRLAIEVNLSGTPGVEDMEVPSFLLQPLVENAVKHAMPAEGKLKVVISSEFDVDDVLVHVADNGVGMSEETCRNILHPESQTGLGIAVKNVHDRMHGFYGTDAEMTFLSELGIGTKVTLRFPRMAKSLE